MSQANANSVVHLELRTPNLPRAYAFYAGLFGWRAETIHAGSQSYLSVDLGETFGGGVVETDAGAPIWLPYVSVPDVREVSERAEALGAEVVLEPREGPVGWRAQLRAPEGGQIGLWQPK